MYNPPIKITGWDANEDIMDLIDEIEEKILQAIGNEINLEIDKEKLIKALITDRAAYYEGYADGYSDARRVKDVDFKEIAEKPFLTIEEDSDETGNID